MDARERESVCVCVRACVRLCVCAIAVGMGHLAEPLALRRHDVTKRHAARGEGVVTDFGRACRNGAHN